MSMEINGSYGDAFGKTYYKNHYAEGMREEREKAKEADRREDPKVKPDNPAQPEEKCTGSTDKADREIEKLKEKKKQLEQRIHAASGDERKTAELRRELAQVESELSRKDNDTYRRQHTVFYRI